MAVKSKKDVKENSKTIKDIANSVKDIELIESKQKVNKKSLSKSNNAQNNKIKINYLYVVLSVLAIAIVGFAIYGAAYYYDLYIKPNSQADGLNKINNDYGNLVDANGVIIADYNDTVSMNYMLIVDGNILDSSYDRNIPLEFTIGAHQMIPGFEQGVIGMSVGEERTFVVSPEDGYGSAIEYQDINISYVYLQMYIKNQVGEMQDPDKLIGTKLYTKSQACIFESYDIAKDVAILKCQHTLAGKSLTFKVQMLDINKYVAGIPVQ